MMNSNSSTFLNLNDNITVAHYSTKAFELLNRNNAHWISKGSPVHWPDKSPDDK